MMIHPQVITKNSIPEFVVLPYKEYGLLLDALENQRDIKSIQEFHETGAETIPFELLKSIADKEKNAALAFREFRKISQSALASKVNISRQYLSQIESGQRKGSSSILKKIASALDIDVDLLIPTIETDGD
jgi:DNA-binding XRE family transcriptional regulator